MPLYCYRCKHGHGFEVFVQVMHPPKGPACPVCSSPGQRDYMSESKNTDLVDNERWSESMGVMPNQIKEAQKTFPGSEYDAKGRLKIKNRRHKKFEMRRRGLLELE